VTDPIRFLTSIGQALAAMSLYSSGHPARERAIDAAFEQLLDLLATDPAAQVSFIDGEVVYKGQVIRELKEWDWSTKLAKIGVQRVEFLPPVQREDFDGFLYDVHQRLSQAAVDTTEARQMGRPSIRFGAIGVRGAETEAATAIATATIAYAIREEAETINWIHEEVEGAGGLPLLEAETVVRGLSIAMHSENQILLPLLQLKEFDQYTTTHSSNVSVLAMALAEHVGLGPREVREFGVAGLLHDLGKVRIPKDILTKPGAFTESERALMRRHPVDGAKIILERERRLETAAVVAYEHHIMLNGGGYPTFKFPRDCHYASKLVHVCDVYDALCTNRPYREAWHSEMALAYLEEKAGTEFDAGLITAFAAVVRESSFQRVVLERPAEGGTTPAE
jgi:putative nucleotidyltransferase with HDIG domain